MISPTSIHDMPSELIAWLDGTDRKTSIHDHAVRANVTWWNRRIADLPGGPVTTAVGEVDGRGALTRGQLFELASGSVDDETGDGALRLLWHSLAWGSGPTPGRRIRAIRSVAADPSGSGRVLREAATASRTDPESAFRLLRDGGRNRISGLGPNFFTKFLYFAGGGDVDHRCLIVDQFVRATAYEKTGGGDPLLAYHSQYSVTKYLATLDVIAAWAAGASTPARPVAADEVEKWAFGYRS